MKPRGRRRRKSLSLYPLVRKCLLCDEPLYSANSKPRTVRTFDGDLVINRNFYSCRNEDCRNVRKTYRPELEGRLAFPRSPFGLDVCASAFRFYREFRNEDQVHRYLMQQRVEVSRTVIPRILSLAKQLFPYRSVVQENYRQLEAADFLLLDMFSVRCWHPMTIKGGGILVLRDCISRTYLDSLCLPQLGDQRQLRGAIEILLSRTREFLAGPFTLLYEPTEDMEATICRLEPKLDFESRSWSHAAEFRSPDSLEPSALKKRAPSGSVKHQSEDSESILTRRFREASRIIELFEGGGPRDAGHW